MFPEIRKSFEYAYHIFLMKEDKPFFLIGDNYFFNKKKKKEYYANIGENRKLLVITD